MEPRLLAGRYALDVPLVPGRVWRGRDVTTGGAVTVTVLPDAPGADAALAAIAAARHPALPVVLGHGVEGARRYLVTPVGSSPPARAALAGRGAPPVGADLAALGAPLAEALAELHRHGLAQGALDLDHVVLDPVGPPRIEDPALGGLASPPAGPDDDVRALGALLRDAARVPADADLLARPGFPPRLAGLLAAMQSTSPPTAADVAATLRGIADGRAPVAAAPATAIEVPAAPRRRGLAVLVGVLAVAVAVLAAVAVATVVDRRDRAEQGLPGPITTVVPAAADTTPLEVPTAPPPTTADDPVVTAVEEAPAGAATAPRRLRVVRVTAVDPGGDNRENADTAVRVTDRRRGSTWSTEVYRDAGFGGKDGVGLVLELEVPSRVTRVTIAAAPAGAEVTIYAVRGALPERPPRDWRAASATRVLRPGRTAVAVTRRVPATAVLVWLSRVPCTGGGCSVAIGDIAVVGVPRGA